MKKRLLVLILCCALPVLAFFLFQRQLQTPAISDPELEIMVGQMIMVGFRGDGVNNVRDVPLVTALARQGKIGGVILFNTDVERKSVNRNVVNAAQLKKLTSSLQEAALVPLFIAVDQEGGQVQRLKPDHGFIRWPYPEDMARMNDEVVEQIGLELGQELAGVGINLNFAPGVDVNVNPKSPAIGLIGRSFSNKPEVVARKARAFMLGLNRAGVIGCFKHFPGHGSALKDTHKGAADVSKTWRELELEPYRQLLGMPGEYGVMIAHVYNENFGDSYPAALSPAVVQRMLRTDLDWEGIVFSDDMQMLAITKHYVLKEAIRLCISAGVDVLVFGNNYGYRKNIGEEVHTAIMELCRDGAVSVGRIEESYNRIIEMKRILPRI